MNITTRDQKDVKVVDLEGKLDTATSPVAEKHLKELIAQGAGRILVNVAKLDYISSAGLRVFLVTAKQLQSTGGVLHLSNLNHVVQEIFEISGFTTILKVFKTESEALECFRGV